MNYHTLSAFHKTQSLSLTALFAAALLFLAMPSSWAQEDQSITITTPKDTYGPGDTVNIKGTVNGGAPGQLVAIQIKDPKGNLLLIRTVQADQNGNFALTFKVPATVSSGAFGITASSRINGYVVTQSAGVAAPVPEFPILGLVLAVGVGSLVAYGMLSNKGLGPRHGFGG